MRVSQAILISFVFLGALVSFVFATFSELAFVEVSNQVALHMKLAGESTTQYNHSDDPQEFQYLLFEAKDNMDKVQFMRKHANGKRVERNVLLVVGLIFLFTTTIMILIERKRNGKRKLRLLR